jgi:UDP-N-acetylglucosamine 2-epimerase (non-hydrolysing)
MWRRIPVVHVEAGLRSGDLTAPFPEEANRRMLGVVADLHLAPTATAVAALAAEHAPPERVVLIGNTVVDAAQAAAAVEVVHTDPALGEILHDVAAGRHRLMLVTAHRRESWGAPLRRVLGAVREIVDENPDVWCVLPAHPNPAVRAEVHRVLDGNARVRVTRPLPYPVLCRLLRAATIVLTDSGGIQEEAPTFRVPVLVLRDVTERPEAVWSGWAELVGTDDARIVAAAKAVLSGTRPRPAVGNPFGDGHAAERAAQAIAWLLGRADRPQPFAGQTGQPPAPGRPRRTQASGGRAAEPLGGPARGGIA